MFISTKPTRSNPLAKFRLVRKAQKENYTKAVRSVENSRSLLEKELKLVGKISKEKSQFRTEQQAAAVSSRQWFAIFDH